MPEHADRLAWTLGGVTAAALVALAITGILLAQFFNPIPEDANLSVRRIMTEVPLGGVLRGIHYWAAQAMYVLVALHLLRVFFTGSHKPPREANWLIGVAMLSLIIAAIFTGTVIKWDQEGFEALAHNLEVARLLGGAGFWFSPELAAELPLNIRLYVAHVAIVPGLLFVLLAVHMMLVKRHGISAHPAIPASVEPARPFTEHLRRLGAFALVLAGALGVLAVLYPPGVGPTPVEGIEITRPLWMFWWLYTLENWIGIPGILWGSGALFALLIAVPLIDRSPGRYWRRRPVAVVLAGAVLIVLAVLTLITAVSTPAEHIG